MKAVHFITRDYTVSGSFQKQRTCRQFSWADRCLMLSRLSLKSWFLSQNAVHMLRMRISIAFNTPKKAVLTENPEKADFTGKCMSFTHVAQSPSISKVDQRASYVQQQVSLRRYIFCVVYNLVLQQSVANFSNLMTLSLDLLFYLHLYCL